MLKVKEDNKYFVLVDKKEKVLSLAQKDSSFSIEIDQNRTDIQILKKYNDRFLLNLNGVITEVFIKKNTDSLKVTFNNKVVTSFVDDFFVYRQRKRVDSSSGDAFANKLFSPMPGLIVDILPSVGDYVKKGEHLLILEAMKMENIIKAPRDAKIKKIYTQKNQSVVKDQLLVEFESFQE